MRIEQRVGSKDDFRQGDTNTTFQDVTFSAGIRTQIGELPLTDHPDAIGLGFGGGKVFVELNDDTTTAVREEGTIVLTVVSKDGSEKEVFRQRTEWFGANGQEDTPSEHNFLPRLQPAGSKALRVYLIADAADGLDSTDHVWRGLPYYIVYP
jgi:hypothetical protein